MGNLRKTVHNILILVSIFTSCKKELKTELPKSDFPLKSDYSELIKKK